MKENFFIITNNPKVYDKLKDHHQIHYQEGDYMRVLKSARDYVYAGHALLTHPLAGSVKPNETPYKSIMIANDKQKLDFQSVEIIDSSIRTCEKFSSNIRTYQQEVFQDFQHIDYSLIENAIASAIAW